MIIIQLKGKDSKKALADLVSNAQYDKLQIEIAQISKSGRKIVKYDSN